MRCFGSRLSAGCVLFVTGVGALGCEHSASQPRVAAPEELGERVAIDAARVTLGFSHGRLRQDAQVAAFQISKYPVSNREFSGCVSAGACRDAKRTCDVEHSNSANSPAVCVGAAQAKAFCAWQGGALPSLSEWLLAARGSTVTRFSWGDAEPTEELHGAVPPRPKLDPDAHYGDVSVLGGPVKLKLGKHGKGASPAGVEDVLLTRGELLRPSTDARFAACASDDNPCVVEGFRPGAIDLVQPLLEASQLAPSKETPPRPSEPRGSQPVSAAKPVPKDDGRLLEAEAAPSPTAYGFRCVWEEAAK